MKSVFFGGCRSPRDVVEDRRPGHLPAREVMPMEKLPSDEEVRSFLRGQGREEDWTELVADEGASYDVEEEIDLSELESLIALPSSPGNVVPVSEVAGDEIYQAYVGSSANPGYRDFAVVVKIVEGRQVHDRVSFDVNSSSRAVLENLVRDGHVTQLLRARASTRPAATAAPAWARRRQATGTAYAPCRATSRCRGDVS
jgi:aconitate hydratase